MFSFHILQYFQRILELYYLELTDKYKIHNILSQNTTFYGEDITAVLLNFYRLVLLYLAL